MISAPYILEYIVQRLGGKTTRIALSTGLVLMPICMKIVLTLLFNPEVLGTNRTPFHKLVFQPTKIDGLAI
jgi:hypothetical protein